MMSHQQQSRLVFFVGPVLLIATVFLVTLLFSTILTPLWLTLPLLAAYYAVIWLFVAMYQRILAGDEPVLKRAELRPAFRGLSLWMLLWTVAYPILSGAHSFRLLAPCLSWGWLVVGIVFSVVNGPSEEIFWRLLLERSGRDGGLSQQVRLWYSSAMFGSWHFIFIVFLFPPELRTAALIATITSTFVAGLLWMIVYQRSGNMFPDIFAHTVTNVLVVFPAAATTMLSLPCAAHSPLAF
jgi:membrane protease YdiL (CAAX protease family)